MHSSLVWNIGIFVAEVGFGSGGVAICCSGMIALINLASISLYCFSPNPVVIYSEPNVEEGVVKTLDGSRFLSLCRLD
jgi:hypothetical protein